MSEATVINNSTSGNMDPGNVHSHIQSDFASTEFTPEKLAMMRFNSSLLDCDDVFSDPGHSGAGKSVGFRGSHSTARAEGRSSLARSSRQVTSSARRTSSFM